MDMRKNQNYLITNQMTVGNKEIVLGKHETKDAYVTWECKGENDYYWGHYHNDLSSAQKDFCKRVENELKSLEVGKKKKEPER